MVFMRFQKKCFCIFRRKGLHLQRFIPFLHTETAKTVYFSVFTERLPMKKVKKRMNNRQVFL